MKKISSNIEIRFNDIDLYGHVNNAVYLSYLEQARINYFNEILGTDHNWETEGIIVANININYLKPVVFQKHITVDVWLEQQGKKSFILAYKIYQNNLEVSNATTTLVCINYKTGNTIQIPEKFIKSFNN